MRISPSWGRRKRSMRNCGENKANFLCAITDLIQSHIRRRVVANLGRVDPSESDQYGIDPEIRSIRACHPGRCDGGGWRAWTLESGGYGFLLAGGTIPFMRKYSTIWP